jgi:hypothetical protein
MFSLADLLKNHPIPGLRNAAIRSDCAEVLGEVLGVPILPKKISYDAGVLTLSLPSVVKSAAHMKYETIQTALLGRGLLLTEIR